MTFNGIIQIAVFCIAVLALTRPLGGYMTKVFSGERNLLSPVLRPVERGFYALAGVDPEREQNWLRYGVAMLLFNLVLGLSLYALLRLQDVLPLNPQGLPALAPDLRAQHGGQLRHQHQLAVLRRRNHDELPVPDAGAHRA